MYEEETRFAERNILNLAFAHYESSNEYGIPDMLPVEIENLENIPLQGFNFALTDKNPKGKGVHFFLHDYQFERVWVRPQRYAEVLSKYEFVLSPDFSSYSDMPDTLKRFNVYRNRWCGRFWQDFGIKVIPTITWSDDIGADYAFCGVPKHSIIAVSTMGEGRWSNYQSLRKNWDKMLDILEPRIILLYGKDLSKQLSGNIIYKRLISSKVAI